MASRRFMVSSWMSAAVVLTLLGAPAWARPEELKGITPKSLNFDKEKFTATVHEKLKLPKATGYAVVIIKNGQVVAEAADGFAIKADWNGFKKAKMTTSTPTNIGSAFKLVSFITLLSQLEKEALEDGGPSEIGPFLDSQIEDYLPRRWRTFVAYPPKPTLKEVNAVKAVGNVTFRELLQHKSGFRQNDIHKVFAYVNTGIQPNDSGKRSYQNINGAILTYLWPRIVDPATADKLDKRVLDLDIANDDYDRYGELYGDFFEQWMQTKVFDVIKPSIHPSCDPGREYPKRNPPVAFALNYSTPLGANPSYSSEKDANGGCHAHGGYYLSMRELAAFMANFQATDVLVTDKVRKLMYDDSKPDNRLGWNKVLTSPFATQHFGVTAIPFHGGGAPNYFTAIVQLPGGYIAVGAVTGGLGLSSDYVANALKNGWAEALRANF